MRWGRHVTEFAKRRRRRENRHMCDTESATREGRGEVGRGRGRRRLEFNIGLPRSLPLSLSLSLSPSFSLINRNFGFFERRRSKRARRILKRYDGLHYLPASLSLSVAPLRIRIRAGLLPACLPACRSLSLSLSRSFVRSRSPLIGHSSISARNCGVKKQAKGSRARFLCALQIFTQRRSSSLHCALNLFLLKTPQV